MNDQDVGIRSAVQKLLIQENGSQVLPHALLSITFPLTGDEAFSATVNEPMKPIGSLSAKRVVRTTARNLLYGTRVGRVLLTRFSPIPASEQVREYTVGLPARYPAATVQVRLSAPRLPERPLLGFSDHVTDGCGTPTDTVLATMRGGFALSHDLGRNWEKVHVRDRRFINHQFVHVKGIGNGELLAQTASEPWHPGLRREVNNLVLNLRGEVLAATRLDGSHWHGSRSADLAGGTLMYAEYPYETGHGQGERAPSRVLRSRDRGRTWTRVFEQSGHQVRHFHFLQARRLNPGEWWLSSGDSPSESRIWVSKNDGETWTDITERFGEQIEISGLAYPRTIFRLTDLIWERNTLLWGTDDYLARGGFPSPAARMFRSSFGRLQPALAGIAKWPIRNIVDVHAFYIVLTQGCARPDASEEERRPQVFLLPKGPIESAPEMVHLFDIDIYSEARTGFTYSRASRASKDGTFFTYRATTDAFPFGHKILRWDVTFT